MTIPLGGRGTVTANDPREIKPSALQMYPLGHQIVFPRKGASEVWIYIQCLSGPGISANRVVERTPASIYKGDTADIDAETVNILGITQSSFAPDDFGFILREGVAEIAHDNSLGAASNGKVVVASATTGGSVDNLVAFGAAYDRAIAAQRECVIGSTVDAANALFKVHCTG